jgi:hypothetical protein
LRWSSKYERTSEDSTKGASSHNSIGLALENTTDAFQTSSPFPLPRVYSMINRDCRNSEGLQTTSIDDSFTVSALSATEALDESCQMSHTNIDSINAFFDVEPPVQFMHEPNNATGWPLWADLSLPLSMSQTPEDQGTELSRHYFIQVCRINSCFDSDANFLRVELGSLMASSPLIYHCVLSMSAAHLAALKSSITPTALDYRSKALSYLQSTIISLQDANQRRGPVVDRAAEALLGSVLLGMTDVCIYHFR